MVDQQGTFLTGAQALDAIQRDFEQYSAQLNLYTVLVPLAFGKDAYLIRKPDSRTVWIKTPELHQPHPLHPDQLGAWIVKRLKQLANTPERLARICTQVFQAPTKAAVRNDGTPGVWVDTGMQDFVCVQCGHCCRTLDYRDGCMPDDYRRWQRLGRDDILKWVGTVHRNGRLAACRIWIQPGTNRYADTCPWLKRGDNPNRYMCAIHDIRPTICRQYPGSRKHARMTGCRGV